MSTHPDPDRSIAEWLVAGAPDRAPVHVLEASRERISNTQQRRAWLPARRIRAMTWVRKYAVPAVLVVAVVALAAIIGNRTGLEGIGGGPAPSPSGHEAPSAGPTASSPSDSCSTPIRAETPYPRDDMPIGRYSFTLVCRTVSFEIFAPRWESFDSFYVSKSVAGPQGAEVVLFWTVYPLGFAAPCDAVLGDTVARTAPDLAAAFAAAPGTDLVSGPQAVLVAERPAQQVAVTVRVDMGCDPAYFFSYPYVFGGALPQRMGPGDAVRLWVLDVDGTLLVIGATSESGTWTVEEGLGVDEAIDRIIESIRIE